ncbi:bifunctional sugar phosphate isomerase/epimerase/4-hydroxyphenylpyruvate dioxygenase family protein [Sphingomonas glacialis]|uniref:3-dehydroshikimate dehydratase n=1 Tax=Sphingomonas glacialis TaxID=658225 RepID=A0A502FWX3_9SPHN|nr:sugar phosphate isomerase/epimerase and 4-hydroxyphenylpyruvate domain-containing protein [Sphingomonas glacialis]TPG53870.1 sugar phosphate isomerase/epimerase and 4-hydroxyphenylpyruvate domain-containing protein [Sphingomonas glacialis]
MRTSIATVSVSGTLEQKLTAIAAAGYDAVEIFETDLLSCAASPREIARQLDDLGLTCALYQPFRDFEGMPGELRQRALDRAERKFDVMAELGTDRILVCSNCSPHSLGEHDRIVDDFRALGERAAARGVLVGYEALAWGRHVYDHRQVWEIVKAVDHPSIGILLDSFHSLSRGIPNESLAEIDPAKIVFVQLADAPLLSMDLLFWSRHFRCMPGQGDLPVAGFVAELLKLGYDGPLSLEIFNDRFRAGSTALVAQDGLRSLVAVHDQAERLIGKRSPLPPPSPIGGIEFIEFAASDEEATRLEPLLAGLGFAKVGQHRTLQVDRWRQGAINLVVNREQRGFAHSYDIMHGASICALGLTVPNPDATLRRARALAIQRYDDGTPRESAGMPALRGVGGSLIYLLRDTATDRTWTDEFRPLQSHAEGAGLERVDHVAASVDIDEFLSWQLYWTALFDVAKQVELDIPDPAGLVQSRAIEGSDGAFRVTMNASGGRGTLSSRFIGNVFGAGFQHIAFTTPDIFATARTLAANGVATLAIPGNYYDDLVARFGLADDLVAEMAALNILFDRDEAGNEYWQLYTRAFEKRFFFEVIERRGAYTGYGAANAPIRLGAQSQFRAEPVA